MVNQAFKKVQITQATDIVALAEEVRRTNRPAMLQRNSENIALLTPVRDEDEPVLAGQPFTMDDPLWDIVGVGESEGVTDVSSNKHKYVADAYADLHE
jgi:hypothetical protein